MSTIKEASPVRYSQVRYGDTLQRIALRELGDASAWVDLALYNDLQPPYIAATQAFRVLAYGDSIAIPAPGGTGQTAATGDAESAYGRDIRINRGLLTASGGTLDTVGGVENLSQALLVRVQTTPGELAFHPDYGCHASAFLGEKNGPAAEGAVALYVKQAVAQDHRVQSVPKCEAKVTGDSITINTVAAAKSGTEIDIRTVL